MLGVMMISIGENKIKRAIRFFDEFKLATGNELDHREFRCLGYFRLNAAKIKPVVDDSVLKGPFIVIKACKHGSRRFTGAEAQLQNASRFRAHDEHARNSRD